MITERLTTKVEDKYEVAVCGGGVAGITAALAAARGGRKTVLFEKLYMLGGLGTAGLVTIYLPLCDGMGKQVSFGIAEELLRLSISCGAEGRYPENWLDGVGTKGENDDRFQVQYNPQIFAVLAEKLLTDNGVDIMYGTYVVSVNMEDDRISHVITENKSGRTAYSVRSVIDATGDCDIAHFAGAPTDTFRQGNILAAWYYSVGKDGYRLNTLGFCDIPDEERVDGKAVEMLADRRFGGLDGREISEFVQLSHQSMFNDIMKRRETDSELIPVTVATFPQLRMTRKIIGDYVLSNTEEHTYFKDSIGMISNWKKRGPVYEVPFGTLYSSKVRNLITAGRCVSVNETMWDIMRVIPCCAVTGQAAGTAAALGDDFTQTDIERLQEALKNDGVVIHENEL